MVSGGTSCALTPLESSCFVRPAFSEFLYAASYRSHSAVRYRLFSDPFLSCPSTWRQTDDKPNALPTPKIVTIRNDKIPLSKALQEMQKQTGINVEPQTTDDPEIAIDLASVPFWEALDTIAAHGHAFVSVQGGISLVNRPAHTSAVSYSGIFRLAVKKITAVRELVSGERYCTVTVEVAWEPGFVPLLLETRPQKLACWHSRQPGSEDDRSGQHPGSRRWPKQPAHRPAHPGS